MLASWLNPDADEETQDLAKVVVPDIPELAEFDDMDIRGLLKTFYEVEATGPWKRMPDFSPDDKWHTPTCTVEDWKHKDVTLEFSTGIVYIWLNRPDKKNYMSEDMIIGLMDIITILPRRQDIRIVVFCAKGSTFCGGDDPELLKKGGEVTFAKESDEVEAHLKELEAQAVAAGAFPAGKVNRTRLKLGLMFLTITRLPQFTLGLANGLATGLGLGFMAASDMTLSVKNAKFALTDLADGKIPGVLAPFLVNKMSLNCAKRFICSGAVLDAETAKHLKLVSEVKDDLEAMNDFVAEMCQVVTACAPGCVGAAKQLVAGVGGVPITEPVMFYTARLLAQVTSGEEARVGMIALQARQPKPWEENPITPLYGTSSIPP